MCVRVSMASSEPYPNQQPLSTTVICTSENQVQNCDTRPVSQNLRITTASHTTMTLTTQQNPPSHIQDSISPNLPKPSHIYTRFFHHDAANNGDNSNNGANRHQEDGESQNLHSTEEKSDIMSASGSTTTTTAAAAKDPHGKSNTADGATNATSDSTKEMLPRIPVVPSASIQQHLLHSEPISTRQERQPFNQDHFLATLREQHPQMSEEDLVSVVEAQKMRKEMFLKLQQRDRREKIRPVKEMFPFLSNEEIIEILDREEDAVDEIYDKVEDWTYLMDVRKVIAERYTKTEEKNKKESDNPATEEKQQSPHRNLRIELPNNSDRSNRPPSSSSHHDDSSYKSEYQSLTPGSIGGLSSSGTGISWDDDCTEGESCNTDYATSSSVDGKSSTRSARNNRKSKQHSNHSEGLPSSNTPSDTPGSFLSDSDQGKPKKSNKNKRKRTSTTSRTKKKSKKRLKLDDALKIKDDQDNFEGWSNARIRAYRSIETNPNAYYYRFNAPGVSQKHGAWDQDEHEAFMARLKEFDVSSKGSPKWGIFSQHIEGRVGYQCANYYRYLLKKGEITDPNYVVENGKLRAISNKSDSGSKKKRSKRTSTRSRSRSKRSSTADSDDEYEAEGHLAALADVPPASQYVNPLPGFTDYITQDEVQEPALSPYGHVLGYKTWLRILNPNNDDDLQRFGRNKCPFTKKRLTKRSLIKLTVDNVDKYRDQIIHPA